MSEGRCILVYIKKGNQMGLYQVTSGESYYVRANSAEEAEAKYYVYLSYDSADQYPDFDMSNLDEDIEEGETDTIVEPVHDFSVSGS
jgi:hypothetical protein